MSQYGATKAYLRSLSLALFEELKAKVDVLLCSPGGVKTKMINHKDLKGNITPEECVKKTLISAGKLEETHATLTWSFLARFWSILQITNMKLAM